jgi:hypothetical protein
MFPIQILGGIPLLVLLAVSYSLFAGRSLRRYGPWGLVLLWVASSAVLSGAFIFVTIRARLPAELVESVALVPVLMTAGSSIFVWRLYKRNPEAAASRFVLHGLAGFGLGFLASLLPALAADIARLF